MPNFPRRWLDRLTGLALLRTTPGRLFLISAAVLLALSLAQRGVEAPLLLLTLRRITSVVFLTASAWLLAIAFVHGRRQFLWRVRRKLILSYVFLGIVPIVLIGAFVLAGGVLLYMSIAAYVFNDGFSDTVAQVRQLAETSAIETGRDPGSASAAIARKYANLASTYPSLSFAVVPADARAAARPGAIATSGAWAHLPPPASVPGWIAGGRSFAGALAYLPGGPGSDAALVLRAAVPTTDGARVVIVDLPLDAGAVARIETRTGIRVNGVFVAGCGLAAAPRDPPVHGLADLFHETTAFVTCTDWQTGEPGKVAVDLDAPVGVLSSRLASAMPAQPNAGAGSWWAVFVVLLVLLGVLFLIVQGAALVMGWVLVKSITSAVHELFIGTERVQQGDFAHRIAIDSHDQLGDLAGSFNRMSGSIERLLIVQRDKQRLDEELRIAREIQQSLLPVDLPVMTGLDIADLCEPAREVGGDYYDFFELGPQQLGVLIADVSGKGTSAALYMAELKGLMLALSHTERSPRQLLIDVNRRLCAHLGNRSFITMTYAVLDLERLTLTAARAGHTPLIVISGGRSEVIIPDGMVLGLSLPDAAARFESALVEHTQSVRPGDVIVLYTDGISEAMDAAGELFGDAALAGVLAHHHALDAAGLRERVVREVKAFVRDAEQHDDMTMVVLKLNGRAA